MNKLAILSLSAVGGTALFAVSFLGFAKLNGTPLHTLPLVGGMFPAPPADPHGPPPVLPEPVLPPPAPTQEPEVTPEAKSQEAQLAVSTPTHAPSREVKAGVLELFEDDGLYTQEELRALADSLRSKNREADQRGFELDRREDLLGDRLTALDERRRALETFAKQLDARERELAAREAELARDVRSSGGARPVPASDMAAFFADGETELLVKRLAGFTPEEGAEILVRLDPVRAKELLDALPPANWRDFAEAYARATSASSKSP